MMKIKRSLLSVVGAGILTFAVAVSASPAQATSKSDGEKANFRGSSASQYSDRDVVDFLIFARGPIAERKPELVARLKMTPVLDAPASVTDKLLADLRTVDVDFHTRVTMKAQAGDPYEAEYSLRAFTEDLNAVAVKHEVTTGALQKASRSAANGSVYAFTNYVVSTQVAVTAVVAASVIGVVAALVVFAYQHPEGSSDIVRQDYAATWSSL